MRKIKLDKYVGLAEIARMLNLTTPRAFQIVKDYKDFPRPKANLKMGRIWKTTDVEEWMKNHPHRRVGRPRGGLYESVKFLNKKQAEKLSKV